MALLSYDAILAALDAGKGQSIQFGKNAVTMVTASPFSLWTATGVPGAGSVAGAAFTAAQASKLTAGAMPFVNAGGSDKLRVVSAMGMTNVANLGYMMLVDRLLYYPGITVGSTGALPFTNSATLPRYTTGEGVMMFLETNAAMTQTTGTFTTSYTNQAGVAGRISAATTYPGNSTLHRIAHTAGLFTELQSSDTGVRSVESITFSTTSSAGSYSLVLARPLFTLPIYAANAAVERDLVLNTPRFPEIVDDACLQWLVWAGTTSSGQMNGELALVAG